MQFTKISQLFFTQTSVSGNNNKRISQTFFHRDQSRSPSSLPKESGNLDRKSHRHLYLFYSEFSDFKKKAENLLRKFPSPIVHIELYSRQRNISHRGLSITLENYEARTP